MIPRYWQCIVSESEIMSDALLSALIDLGRHVRTRVCAGMASSAAGLADPSHVAAGDLQYGIDRLSEEDLLDQVTRRFSGLSAVRVLSEGLDEGGIVVPGPSPRRLLVIDPIDGTRGLMHDKRSAFFLAALAEEVGVPSLRGITHAVMVEIPTTRGVLSDLLAAGPSGPLFAATDDLRTGACTTFMPRPSSASDLRHGFATVVRFFAGAAERLGLVHDRLLRRLHSGDGIAQQDAFEDQYISNGGQMHALITGRDRFVADLRPLVALPDGAPLRCAHPYDVTAAFLAERAGVVVTDPQGRPLDVPLDLTTRVAWVGYANPRLRARVEPELIAVLRETGLLPRD